MIQQISIPIEEGLTFRVHPDQIKHTHALSNGCIIVLASGEEVETKLSEHEVWELVRRTKPE
jgi:hypothetical protein